MLAADNGRPVKRARVFASAAELPGGRGMLTDDSGVFDLTELPAGRYTLTVSKSGFVALSYGQRRPLQAGTPLQLADGQQLKGIEFQLPRGSVISGRVLDEDGDAMPGVTVRVMRYQYLQGERRLTPAGNGQTDDKGIYRVWGLMPGDYYVNAIARGGGPGGGQFGGPGGLAAADAAAGAAVRAAARDRPEQVNYAPTYYPGVPSVNEAKPVTVGLSQEVLDINFGMQLVRVVADQRHRIEPRRHAGDQRQRQPDRRRRRPRANQIGVNFGGRIQWDGAFTISNVAPGRYILRARGDDSETPQFAAQPISVSGDDLSGRHRRALGRARRSAARCRFCRAARRRPDVTQFRITAPSTDQSDFGPQPNARVDKDGTSRSAASRPART